MLKSLILYIKKYIYNIYIYLISKVRLNNVVKIFKKLKINYKFNIPTSTHFYYFYNDCIYI